MTRTPWIVDGDDPLDRIIGRLYASVAPAPWAGIGTRPSSWSIEVIDVDALLLDVALLY